MTEIATCDPYRGETKNRTEPNQIKMLICLCMTKWYQCKVC